MSSGAVEASRPAPAADETARLLPFGADLVGLDLHVRRLGPVPYRGSGGLLIRSVEAAGLTGRGGGGFPTSRKLAAVARGRGRKVVVANAGEGEPASSKDKVLMMLNPHLVLDGLQLAAEAVGADLAYLYLHPHPAVVDPVRRALAERLAARIDACPVKVVEAEDSFISGEESAVVSHIERGRALPSSKPPMVFERGVAKRPTLVQNVETLAQLALIARFGADWFRALGTPSQPGTMLFTVAGAVASPGVVEAPGGSTIRSVVGLAGGPTDEVGAVLVGGYHGAWLPGGVAADLALDTTAMSPYGAKVGAGVVGVLPKSACGLVESARIVRYLADQSAGQCGPCQFGLPSIASDFDQLAGRHWRSDVRRNLERRAGVVERRGACHHPDGTVRLVRSTLQVFADELDRHARGGCSGIRRDGVFPVPAGGGRR